ncbi:MAG TPA: hypothetical protein VKU02_00765 [Gemmataceae bacterium]|nr:hypothetical protein [Gemmataceae bacterium]
MWRGCKALWTLGMFLVLARSSSAQLFDPGDVIVTNIPYAGMDAPNGVLAINPVTGDQDVVSTGGLFVNPFDLRIAPNGNIIVLDGGSSGNSGTIISVDPKSGLQTALTTGGYLASAGSFGAVHVDAGGNVYVCLSGVGVFQVDPATGMQTIISGGGNLIDPSGLASTSDGNLYVGDYTALGGALFRIDVKSGTQTVIASGGMINGVIDIAVEPGGTVLIENQNDSIVRVDPSNGMQTLVTSGLVGLNGLGVGSDGQIYVSSSPSSSDPSSIIRVDPVTGSQTTISTAGSFGFLGGLVQAP